MANLATPTALGVKTKEALLEEFKALARLLMEGAQMTPEQVVDVVLVEGVKVKEAQGE